MRFLLRKSQYLLETDSRTMAHSITTPISKKHLKRAIGSKPQKDAPVSLNRFPRALLEDSELNDAISALPRNYSFEIHKTIHQIRVTQAKTVALQMPEGLLLFACTIADTIERFTDAVTVIMGDVTYGACCIDDYTAIALGCDMMVHYGHSCLVPIDSTRIKTLYVFVEISIDSNHLINTIRKNFPSTRDAFRQSLIDNEQEQVGIVPGTKIDSNHLKIIDTAEASAESERSGQSSGSEQSLTRLALVSTIQFATALHDLGAALSRSHHVEEKTCDETCDCRGNVYDILVPRSKPLSPGEILGCTAPRLDGAEAILYLGDGRFHLESIMIANPLIPAFRYDPYSKKITRERYDHAQMRATRRFEIEKAIHSAHASEGKHTAWGLILGTLGRQGNTGQMKALQSQASSSNPNLHVVPILLSELSPAKLNLLEPHLSAFIQTSCPRLSIDWGYAFERPLLSPYEATVAFRAQAGWNDDGNWDYPMDFYATGTLWSTSRLRGHF